MTKSRKPAALFSAGAAVTNAEALAIGSDNLAELEVEAYAGERAVVNRLGDS